MRPLSVMTQKTVGSIPCPNVVHNTRGSQPPFARLTAWADQVRQGYIPWLFIFLKAGMPSNQCLGFGIHSEARFRIPAKQFLFVIDHLISQYVIRCPCELTADRLHRRYLAGRDHLFLVIPCDDRVEPYCSVSCFYIGPGEVLVSVFPIFPWPFCFPFELPMLFTHRQ